MITFIISYNKINFFISKVNVMSNISIVKNSFFQRVLSPSRAIDVDDKQKILNDLCNEDSKKFFIEFNKLMASKDKTQEKNNLIQKSIRVLITSCGYDIGITASITVAIIYHLSKIKKSTNLDDTFIENSLKGLELSKHHINQIIKYIKQMKNAKSKYTAKIYLNKTIVLGEYAIEYPEKLQPKEKYFIYNEYTGEFQSLLDDEKEYNNLDDSNEYNFTHDDTMKSIKLVKNHLETHKSTKNLTWKENKQKATLSIYNYMNKELKEYSINDKKNTLKTKKEKTACIKKIKFTLEYVLDKLQKSFNRGLVESFLAFDDLEEEIKNQLNENVYNNLTGNFIESDGSKPKKLLKNLKIIVTHKNTDGFWNNSNTKTRWFAGYSRKHNIRTDTHEKIRQAIIKNRDYDQLPAIKGLVDINDVYSGKGGRNNFGFLNLEPKINHEIEEESSELISELEEDNNELVIQSMDKEKDDDSKIDEPQVNSEPFGLKNFENDCFIISAIQFILNNEILLNAILNHPDKNIKDYFKEMILTRGEKKHELLMKRIREIAEIALGVQDSTCLVLNRLFNNNKFILSKSIYKKEELILNEYDIFTQLNANKKDINLLKEVIPNILCNEGYDNLRNFVLNNQYFMLFKKLFDNKTIDEFKMDIMNDADLRLLQQLLYHEEFQQKINGSQFLWFDSSNYGATLNKKMETVLGDPLKWNEIRNNENINAIVIHRGGTVNSGHYFTYIKKNDQWYECNDDKIIKISDIATETQNKRIVAFSYEHTKYIITENDKFKYEGEMNENGEMHGRGKIFWKDTQHTYVGEFKNDCPCGSGVLYKNNNIFDVMYKMTGDKESQVYEEVRMV